MRRSSLQKPQVLMMGERDDAHLPFVERHLDAPIITIDTLTTANGDELSFAVDQKGLRIVYKGKPLNNITGVWVRGLRSPGALRLPVSEKFLDYSRSALQRHTEALLTQLRTAVWVSDHLAIKRADYKPLQLQEAARLGFAIPETLFTSSPAEARRFIDERPATIVKPLSALPISRNEKTGLAFYATKIMRNEPIDLSGLHLAPAIFQQAIEPAMDLRVTVIGEKIFPAMVIDKKASDNTRTRDWRIGSSKNSLHIEPYTLPKDLAKKCLNLIKVLGLNFGAIDLVLDKKGKAWFLENNAIGQWAFVELETGQPMSKAMADLLQGRD